MNAPDKAINRRRWRIMMVLLVVAGLIGALVSTLLFHLFHIRQGTGYWSTLARAWPAGVGLLLVSQGLIIALMSSNRRRTGHMVDPGDPHEASVAQMTFYRSRALTLFLAGGALLVPASLSAWPGMARLGPVVMLVLMAVLLLGAAVTGTRMWRAADDFTRGLIAGSALFSLLASLGLLITWQVAARIGVTTPASAWNATGLVVVLYLIVDSMRLVRHGYFF